MQISHGYTYLPSLPIPPLEVVTEPWFELPSHTQIPTGYLFLHMVMYISKLLCPHYFWLGAWSAALRRILRLHSASGEVKMCGWWMPTAVLKSWCDMRVLRTWHTLSVVQTLFPDPSHCSYFCLSVSRIFIHSLLWWCNLKYLCTTYWGTRNKASYQLSLKHSSAGLLGILH